jgi:membrane protease YdiL (CAAX protease family)
MDPPMRTPGRGPTPMSLSVAVLHFGLPTLGLFAATHWGLPRLVLVGIAPLAAWYLAGLAVFAPLLGAALVRSHRESTGSPGAMAQRLWLRRPRPVELVRTALVLAGVLAGSAAVFWAMVHVARAYALPAPEVVPSFLQGLDLARGTGTVALLLLWVPFFCCNILGEELFWRGYILPRQELAFGRYAWAINGVLWGMFHLPFGCPLLLLLLPILGLLPWLVQRYGNVWLGVIVHGVYNGVPSLLIACGGMPTP